MILRLQSEQELELLQSRIKAKSKAINVHVNELRTNTGTDPEKGGNHANPSNTESSNGRLSNAVTGVASVKTRLRAAHKGPRATFEHQLLGRQLAQSGIAYEEEFRFEPKRRWKADFYIPRGNFLVEIVGGLWLQRSGHSHGKAQLDDMEKFNHAAKLGFRVLQFSPDQVKSGEAIGFIGKALL